MASTGLYSTLRQNAGYTEEQWAEEIAMEAEAQNVMLQRVSVYPQTGSKIHIPRMSKFNAASTFTKGTGGDEGTSITTYTVVSDTDAEITPVTAYVKTLLPIAADAEMSPQRANNMLNALRIRMGQALGKKAEVTLLGEYAGATTPLGDADGYHCIMFSKAGLAFAPVNSVRVEEGFHPDRDGTFLNMYQSFGVQTVWPNYIVDVVLNATDPSWDLFLDAYSALKQYDSPEPYTWVVHPIKAKALYKTPEFWQAAQAGDAVAEAVHAGRRGLTPLGVEILFSTNVVNA